jgi:hypothetical protein
MKTSINWVCSAGGPLILIPAEVATHWRGVEGWSLREGGSDLTGESSSDYARACDVDDYLGMLEVGPGMALILGDEPMQTAFLPSHDGVVVVRWMYAEDEDGVWRAVGAVPESAWELTPHRIEVAQDAIVVFDSAYPGDILPPALEDGAATPWIRIELPSGTYLVDMADYGPDSSTRLILHRLRKLRADLADSTLPTK